MNAKLEMMKIENPSFPAVVIESEDDAMGGQKCAVTCSVSCTQTCGTTSLG